VSISKTKNIAIALLVFINVFLLAVIIIDNIADARDERNSLENTCAVMQAGGVGVDPENIKAGTGLRTMRTVRGDEAEEAIARAVLGDTEMTDQGVIYLYENPHNGTALFASAGDFEITLNRGVVTAGDGKLREVQRILRDMAIETSSVESIHGNESETFIAVCRYSEYEIFNCIIEFIWDENDLQTIKGRYVTGFEIAEGGTGLSSVSTALLAFLAAVKNENRDDISFSYIYSMESGYQHRVVGAFGEGEIIPSWLVFTDTGRYIFDSATGEIQSFG